MRIRTTASCQMPCYDVLFPHCQTLHVFILVGKLLKNPNILGQTRDTHNICTVTKAGLLTGYMGGTAQFGHTRKITYNFQNPAKSHILKDLLKCLMKSGIRYQVSYWFVWNFCTPDLHNAQNLTFSNYGRHCLCNATILSRWYPVRNCWKCAIKIFLYLFKQL